MKIKFEDIFKFCRVMNEDHNKAKDFISSLENKVIRRRNGRIETTKWY